MKKSDSIQKPTYSVQTLEEGGRVEMDGTKGDVSVGRNHEFRIDVVQIPGKVFASQLLSQLFSLRNVTAVVAGQRRCTWGRVEQNLVLVKPSPRQPVLVAVQGGFPT